MVKLLHLSDLHITTADAGTQFDRDAKIREALISDLGKEDRNNFAAILVTGDLAYHGESEEFTRVKGWLEELRTETNVSPEGLFVIPGNHDVNRKTVSKDSSIWDLHQSLRKIENYEEQLASLNKKLQDSFDFLAALSEYRAFAVELDCPTNPRELAWVQVLAEQLLEDGSSVRLHGLNSALLSDPDDKKANLLVGAAQFHHFDSHPGYVNVVLCHHPHSWLMDGNQANDFFRNQAHVVLCGHEHDLRCYKEGHSIRVFAGAVHPNPREAKWEPCYHVITLSIQTAEKRVLTVKVETRVWRDKDKIFGPHVQSDGSLYAEEHIDLPPWKASPIAPTEVAASPASAATTPTAPATETMPTTDTNGAFAAARRKLIVHFFRLGTLSRYEAVIKAGVWEDSDDAFDGQARWARVFERAEKGGNFDVLWDAVAVKDATLAGQPNPFKT